MSINTFPTDVMDISTHQQRFSDFIGPYLAHGSCLPLEVKREHTAQVLALAQKLVIPGNGFSPQAGRAALLAALYHDIGRFPQYQRWHTFSDARSENHGTLSVRVVKQHGFLNDEPQEVKRLALAAVGMHNRYLLPRGLLPATALVTHAVRDADKIDIFRVLAKHFNQAMPSGEVVLHVLDEPDQWSPQVVQTVLSGRMVSYAELHYINDFRMLLASWLRELHFADSQRILGASGHVETVLDGLPKVPELAAVRAYLYRLLEQAQNGQLQKRIA